MEKIELVTATLIIIARPLTFSPFSVRHGPRFYHFRPTYRTVHVRGETAGNSSNFSYVNFMQNFPASVVVQPRLAPRSFSPSPSAKWNRQRAHTNPRDGRIGIGILEILAEYFLPQSSLPRCLRGMAHTHIHTHSYTYIYNIHVTRHPQRFPAIPLECF